MPKFSTRIQRRQQQRECYLVGEARRPYTHTPTLQTSLTEASCSSAGSSTSVCFQCGPILLRYKTVFKELIHQGSELKKRKGHYPHPKRAESIPYRDIKRQNEWLRENVFDSMGNYLYCCSCVRATFGVSKQRIANQRKIKQQQFLAPLKQMTKMKVEEERLGSYVVMPAGLETPFHGVVEVVTTFP